MIKVIIVYKDKARPTQEFKVLSRPQQHNGFYWLNQIDEALSHKSVLSGVNVDEIFSINIFPEENE